MHRREFGERLARPSSPPADCEISGRNVRKVAAYGKWPHTLIDVFFYTIYLRKRDVSNNLDSLIVCFRFDNREELIKQKNRQSKSTFCPL